MPGCQESSAVTLGQVWLSLLSMGRCDIIALNAIDHPVISFVADTVPSDALTLAVPRYSVA